MISLAIEECMDIELWKRLENSTKIRDANSRWTLYREQVTEYIIEEIEIGDTVLILGAGACNDIDLSKLLPYAKKIILADRDLQGMKQAVQQYRIPKERIQLVQIDFWKISACGFEEKLKQAVTIEELISFLKEETDRVTKEQLIAIQADFVVNIGLYSQLNAILAGLFYLKRDPYGISEREKMSKMLSYMNQEAVQKVNNWMLKQYRRGIVGYEYAVFGAEEEEKQRCKQVQFLLQTGQVELLKEIPIARVEGGWQGESDLARRYREGSIAFRSNRYFIWNFLPEKSYIMQCYAIVSEEVSSCE